MKKILFILCFYLPLIAQEDACISLAQSARAKKRIEKEMRIKERAPKIYESGREYYDSLIQDAAKRHWAFPISFYYSFADDGYGCDAGRASLGSVVFGKCPITIQDIYLFSKLSIDNKVRIKNCDALAPNRGGIPIGMAGQPFGMFSDDLYTTLLAPVQLLFDLEQKEFTFVPSAIFHYDFGENDRYGISAGFNFPITSITHEMSLNYKGGELFRNAFVPDTIQQENSLDQFHRDYSDVEDFVLNEVLGSKGIFFEPSQRTTGFADVSLFTAFEYHSNPSIEVGFALVFPTGNTADNNVLWEPIRGNGGSFQFNPFMQVLFSTVTPYLNPFIRVAGECNSAYTSENIRVPRLVTNPVRQQVKDVSGLAHPSFFDNFYVDPFSEYDSCVPLLSDKACIKINVGNKVIVGLGNYAYDLFHENFRWGLFYDFVYKAKDSYSPGDCGCCCGSNSSVDLCLTCSTIDTYTLEECSFQNAHIVSTNLTYKFNNLFELSFGGEFAITGKNIPRRKSIYFTVVAVF